MVLKGVFDDLVLRVRGVCGGDVLGGRLDLVPLIRSVVGVLCWGVVYAALALGVAYVVWAVALVLQFASM